MSDEILVDCSPDLAGRIADYMITRNTPWKDEGEMREVVKETVRLMLTEARDDTIEALGLADYEPLVLAFLGSIPLSVVDDVFGSMLRGMEVDAKPAPDTPCERCGHRCYDHIYGEGACRPGFVCAVGCTEFVGAS